MDVPSGDYLIICGDITLTNIFPETVLSNFNKWLGKHKHQFQEIFVIGGNHDMHFRDLGKEKMQRKLTNATYLDNSMAVTKSDNITIFGCPWSPNGRSGNKGWQFSTVEDNEEFLAPLSELSELDILISHAGSHLRRTALNASTKRVKIKVNVFGHFHEQFGVKFIEETAYVNCALLNKKYWPLHPVTVVDLKRKGIVASSSTKPSKPTEEERYMDESDSGSL